MSEQAALALGRDPSRRGAATLESRLAGPEGPRRSTGSAPLRRAPLVRQAYAFAARAHAGQVREADAKPYVEHVRAVGSLLSEAGFADHVVAAGLLHDVVEKTDVSHEQVRGRFGPTVAELVAALTEPAGIADYRARKAALRDQVMHAGRDAQAIFAADKLESVSSLLAAADEVGDGHLQERLREPLDQKVGHYEATLALLEQAPQTPPFIDRLRSELGELSSSERAARALAVAERVARSINGLDAGGLAELCRRDVEWWSALTLGTRGLPYRGHDGLRRYVEDLARAWSELHIEVYEHRQVGDRQIAIWDITARAGVSGRPVAQQSALVYTLRDRLIASAADYLDAAAAAAAVAPRQRHGLAGGT